MAPSFRPLDGIRILSLALNLPGPAALQRCADLGAVCSKLEPLAAPGQRSSDPMLAYTPQGYEDLHQGIRILQANLKTAEGQALLHEELARTDVLLTSFRKSAMLKLGVDWNTLHARHPQLSLVAIYGNLDDPDEAGHDLTYQAQNDLVNGLHMPPTLFADMSGALMATEAVLGCCLHRQEHGCGTLREVGLSQAVSFLAIPRTRYAMLGADTPLGGQHVGYRVYTCQDGRVALAALEPVFYQRLCQLIGGLDASDPGLMLRPETGHIIGQWLAGKTRAELGELARQHDLPLETLPA